MTARQMFDAVNVAAIPPDAQMIAGYLDGTWPNAAELARTHPHAQLVTITVTGRGTSADVADVESGDLSPAGGAQWAAAKVRTGGHPTLYCSLSPWPEVRAQVRHAGLDPDLDVSWWIASYDGSPTIPAGAIAKQYLGNTDAGHYGGAPGAQLDVSSVRAFWPGVDGPAAPPAPPGSLTIPPPRIVHPVWLQSSPDPGEDLGWREASKVTIDDRRACYAPGGQRLIPWPSHGWTRPQLVAPAARVPGWTYTATGWRHTPGTP